MSKRDEIKLLFAKGTGFYAQGHFTQALTIFQDIWAKTEVEDLDINAAVLCFLAKIYHKFGDFQKGKEFGKLALTNARKSGKPDLIVQCQIILGHVYVHLSNYDKAKMLFKNSLQIMQEFKIKKLMPLAVDCLQELGNIYQIEKKLDKAIKCYEQALNIAKNEKNNEKINYLLQKVALCQINLGRTEEAVKTTTSITNKGKALDVIGTLYYVSGNYEAAGSCMEEALATVSRQKDNLKIVQILNSLGSIRKQMGEYEKALHYFTKAAKILTDYYLPDEAYRIYYNLGRVYEQLKDTNKAIECYEQAVNYIEELRSEIGVEDYQLGFMVDKERVYEALIELYVKTGKEMDAWHYLERAKSRYLLSLLSSPQIHIQKGLKEKEIGKEQNILSKITKLRKELYQVGPHEQAELQQQLLEATKEYKDFLAKIQLSNPELASLKLVTPFSLEEIQFCLNQDEVLIEYFYSKEKLYCWVLSQKDSQCIELSNITQEVLKARSQKLLECFDNKGGDSLVQFQENSKILYKLLIRPLEKVLAGHKTVGIIPYKLLHYIPFHALYDGEKYLIEKYEVFYLHSASLVKICREKNKEKKESLLVLANPKLKKSQYQELPSAESEAKDIANIFGNEKSKILIGLAANKENLRGNIANEDIIHFACHGVFDGENPLLSGLVLATKEEEPDWFYLNDILNLELKTYLVTLSACESGRSKLAGGDELIGLNRAFIYAGTPSVLASMWKVADESTAILMKEFYTNIVAKGQNKAQALRNAQIYLLKKPKVEIGIDTEGRPVEKELQGKHIYEHPFFWAPFFLTGDWR